MMAMFRFLCGLPYQGEEGYWHDEQSVATHARVYVVAEKYQVAELKDAAMDVLLSILLNDTLKGDLPSALRTIFSATLDTDIGARPLLVKYCVNQLSYLKKRQDFRKLLEDCAFRIPECSNCDVTHEQSTWKENREQAYWHCWACNGYAKPRCSQCEGSIEWGLRGQRLRNDME